MRQTSEQIDEAILDAAAHTFAVHGFARTSVQQLADAVGYSKTGLLHRFPGKQVLHDAAVAATCAAIERVLAAGGTTTAVLDAVTVEALDRPGLVELLVASIRPASQEPGREQLHERATHLVDTLGGTDPEPRLRAVLALKLIVDAATRPTPIDRARLRLLLVELACRVAAR